MDVHNGSVAPNAQTELEPHSSNSELVRDAIIGLADGLTVPFALTAGLSSVGSTHLVILGGLAELFAGSISMGLGAYLAALTDTKHYEVEFARETRQIANSADLEDEEMYGLFAEYGLGREVVEPLARQLRGDPEAWVKFMMDFELKLERPKTSRGWISALVMGISYFVGGLIPMIPYFAVHSVNKALFISIGVTCVVLLIFGYCKAIATGTTKRAALYGAVETLGIGALAAGVSYGIVRGVNKGLGGTTG